MKIAILAFLICSGAVGQTSQFPAGIDNDQQLGVVSNNVFGTLYATQQVSDTAIQVKNGSCFANGASTSCNVAFKAFMFISVDAEIQQICSITTSASSTTLNLGILGSSCPNISGRGLDGTTAAIHNNLLSKISNNMTAWTQNAKAKAIQAIETTLSTYYWDTIPNTTLANNCTASQSAGKTLAITQVWTNVATIANCGNIMFWGKGSIQPANGATITASPQSAPYRTICDISLGGTCKFSASTVYPVWYGADSTGGTDSGPAFNAAGKSVVNNGLCGRIKVFNGTYQFNTGVSVGLCMGLNLEGDGSGTLFTWGGNNSTPLITVAGCFSCSVGNFKIKASTAAQLKAGVSIIRSVSSPNISTRNYIHDIVMEGTNGGITDGLLVDMSGGDANNDFHHFDHITVLAASDASAYLQGHQSFNNLFTHCVFQSNGYVNYGVRAGNPLAPGTGGAGFQFKDGAINSELWDFYLQDYSSGTGFVMENIDDESDGGLLYGAMAPVGIISFRGINRYAHQGTSASTLIIDCESCGLVSIEGLWVENLSSTNTNQITMKYVCGTCGNAIHGFRLKDVFLVNDNQTLASLFTASDSYMGAWLTLDNVLWQNHTSGARGYYGGMPFSPASGINNVATNFTVNSTITQDVSRGTAFGTGNTLATALTTITGCGYVGQLITLKVNDANTTIVNTGNIKFSGASPLALVNGSTYLFSCVFTDASSSTPFWNLIQTGGR